MRLSKLASAFGIITVIVGSAACSTETDPLEGNDEQGDGEEEKVAETSAAVGTCATSCTREVGSTIACSLTSSTVRSRYTCRPKYGKAYTTGCVANRGASYCLSYL